MSTELDHVKAAFHDGADLPIAHKLKHVVGYAVEHGPRRPAIAGGLEIAAVRLDDVGVLQRELTYLGSGCRPV